jgi:hypothetical protein
MTVAKKTSGSSDNISLENEGLVMKEQIYQQLS